MPYTNSTQPKVDSSPLMQDGHTEYAVKCQTCGFVDCCCGVTNKEMTDKSAEKMSW